jgi:hypothetical protein
MTSTRTTPALSLRSAARPVRREAPVRASVKASKAHRDRLPGMVYADRLTANARAWDNHGTSRAAARARLLDAVGTPGRTLSA